uniref:Succinate:cytochrome c oxidoreductase subunit 4 n=1 Tax=Ahnfeltia plicata TaxID=28023 RepID=A0A0A7A701_9FLOR|nr:succinate:cytochrome c oxidoreductase subunit 4 [Ahnfeltia plicata]AHB62118.1 succinate:cytochrome c oxidoreductase subunit 4 [Ahnfeltia plicata]UAT97999.1 succinate:cytochrome c oxidoreductase subunit 4 [Ahnfeltia plicata]UAT98025.1 succinate:cytochrome c oxidoreductase subunit 4 [Ahnfeltia plicata]
MTTRNLYWWTFRLSSLFIVPGFFVDFEMVLLIQTFLFLHVRSGLGTLIDDYVHNRKTKFVFLLALRILSVEMPRYVLELLL